MNIPRTSYSTNSYTLPNLYALIIVAVAVSVNVMILAMMMGAGIILGMLALFVPMLLVFGFFTGEAEFVLDSEGVYKHVRPYLRYKLSKYEKTSFYPWNDVLSYKTGTDMNRSMQQYEYLEIKLLNNVVWQITDQKDRISFLVFKSAFTSAVEMVNAKKEAPVDVAAIPTVPEARPVESKAAVMSPKIETHQHVIGKEATFYESIWAKVFLWVTLVFAFSLMAFIFLHPKYLTWTTIFRFAFVIVPGVVYMCYRVYGKKSQQNV